MLVALNFMLPLICTITVWLVYQRWDRWVGRLSPFVWPFRRRKRFGLRSWATRAFLLNTSADEIRRHLDLLPEISAESLMYQRAADDPSGISALFGMFPGRRFPTGIEIEWLNADTLEIHCKPYADWPASHEDQAPLPLKQRQRLADHMLLYLEPQPLGGSRVSYELQTPAWFYIALAAASAMALWIAWAISTYSFAHTLFSGTGVSPRYWLPIGILWAPAIVGVARILRLQSVSLMDSVVSTFGELIPHAD